MIGLTLAIGRMGRDPWLDEFWTMWTGSVGAPAPAFLQRMSLEVHPLLYYIYIYALQNLGIESVKHLRLFNITGIFVVFCAAYFYYRRRASSLRELVIVVAAYSSSAVFIGLLPELRTYFILFSFSIALSLLWILLFEVDDCLRRDQVFLVFAWAICLFIFVNLHYFGTLFGGLLTAALVIKAIHRRKYGSAGLLALIGAVSAAPALVCVAIQLPNASNITAWVTTTDGQAVRFALKSIYYAAGQNYVLMAATAIALVLILKARKFDQSATSTLILGSVVAAFFAVALVINHFKPVIYINYLFAAGGGVLLVASRLAADAAMPNWTAAAICVAALIAQSRILSNGETLSTPGWSASAAAVATLYHACPTSRVYAANFEARVQQYWGPTLLAYSYYAHKNGFPFETPQPGRTIAAAGACPSIIWIEHRALRGLTTRAILQYIDLRAAGPAQAMHVGGGTIVLVRP